MAGNCAFCGKNIGFFNEYTCNIGNREIKICNKCSDKFFPLKRTKEFNIDNFDSFVPDLRSYGFTNEGIAIAKEFCEIKKIETDRKQAIKEEKERAENEKFNAENEARIRKENEEREKRESRHSVQINALKESGFEGYYEYKVLSLEDGSGLFNKSSGRIDIERMSEVLNELGMDGWHLAVAYSNELGKNAVSAIGLGLNSSIDEHILIFERFKRI